MKNRNFHTFSMFIGGYTISGGYVMLEATAMCRSRYAAMVSVVQQLNAKINDAMMVEMNCTSSEYLDVKSYRGKIKGAREFFFLLQ